MCKQTNTGKTPAEGTYWGLAAQGTPDLTASRVLVSNSSGDVAASAITEAELNQLDGVTDNVQDQLDKLNGKMVFLQTAPQNLADGFNLHGLTYQESFIFQVVHPVNSPNENGVYLGLSLRADTSNGAIILIGLNLSGNTYIEVQRNGVWGGWGSFDILKL